MEGSSRETAGNRRFVWGLTASLISLALLAGCDAQGEAKPASPPPPEVDVARVVAEPVTVTETFTGRVDASETVELRPRVSGYVHEVAFEEGEMVEAGDLLFRIDPRPYQAKVKAARAELAQARSDLQLADTEASRAKQLLESRAISREEYDRRQAARLGAQASVNAARAALETAELDLQYTRITAPVSGRTGRALVTQGNLARADQTLLTTVVAVDPLHVYFDSNEASAMRSQPLLGPEKTTPVRIGLAGEESFPHRGELDFVDNRLNASTGTLQYRAVLANPDGTFKPGQFARVEMPVAELDKALLVNRKAVLTDQDRRYVYVVDDSNQVARRQVTTGHRVDDLLVIREGLESGDRVIVNGTQKIFSAGMKVTPNQIAMRGQPAVDDTAMATNRP